VTATAFFSFERLLNHQRGYYASTPISPIRPNTGSDHDHDTVHTAGVKADLAGHRPINSNSVWHYTPVSRLSDMQSRQRFRPPARVVPLPNVRAITHNAGIAADYTFKENMTLRAGI